MKTLKFRNNDTMSILGLGTWKSEKGAVYQAVRDAIEVGYRHIDCAAIYFNEKEIGKALADAFKEGDVKREEMWITSKLWCNSHGNQYVKPALEKTLKDLQLDYLDLYLIHWPVVFKNHVVFPEKADDLICLTKVPISLTWTSMEACVGEGLTRHIGVSNFSVKKLDGLMKNSRIKPEMNQIEMHPFLQQEAMLEYSQKNHIHLTAYSPLGSGDRDSSIKGEDEPILIGHPTIMEIAFKHQCTPAQVLIAWAINRNTAVIPKSTNKGRIKENFEAQFIKLTNDEMKQIAGLNLNFRYIDGSFFALDGGTYTLENLWDE